MTINTIVTTTILSSTIASLLTYFLKQYFDRRLEFHFDKKLELLKAELTLQAELTQQFSTRRLDIYPRIAELVYRLRNNLRDICEEELLPMTKALDFIHNTDEYIEEIYHSRLDLERDQIFLILHAYKNEVISAKNVLLDWMIVTADGIEINDYYYHLQQKYQQIDRRHKKVISQLTKLTKIE